LKKYNQMNGITMGYVELVNQPKKTKKNVGHLDDMEVKVWRSASIIIEYDEAVVEDAATAERGHTDGAGPEKWSLGE
jgi:hypothetical protein